MKETELAKKFIEYLSDYDIYQEVPYCGIIDIVGRKGPITIAVEVKLSLNFEVISQAVKNKSCCNFSYIAVPYARSKSFAYDICKRFGIGVLVYHHSEISGTDQITEAVKPSLNRKCGKLKLHEYMKLSVAGSQNDRVTAFGNTIMTIASFLQRKKDNRDSIKNILKSCEHHYSTITSAKACIINMCRQGVIKEFYYEDGHLILNKAS